LSTREGYANFIQILQAAHSPLPTRQIVALKDPRATLASLDFTGSVVRAALRCLQNEKPLRIESESNFQGLVDRAVEDGARSRLESNCPRWYAYAESALHLSERTLGLRCNGRGRSSWVSERSRAANCGTYSTPGFIIEAVMAELVRLLPCSGAPLHILDQSLEAGHFAFGAMARLHRQRVRFFGVDRDPIAIAMARRLFNGFRQFSDPAQFSFRATVADSLFGELPRGWPQHFNCVVGNPPWKGTDRRVMAPIWNRYSPPLKGQFDAYLAFILRAHERVMPGGLISLVVPSSLLSNLNAEPVRRLLLKEYDILSLILFPRRSFIELPCVVPVCFTARKRGGPEHPASCKTRVVYHPIYLGGVKRPRLDVSASVAQRWQRTPGCVFHPLLEQGTEFLLQKFDMPDLSSFGAFGGGKFCRAAGEVLVTPLTGFRARDVRVFHACRREAEYFAKGCRQFERPPKTSDILRPKVVFKNVRCVTIAARLAAAELGPREFGVGSCSVFIPADPAQTGFFVGLFNSSFANAWYKSRDLCRAIKFWHLRNLPALFDLASWDQISQSAKQCSQIWREVHDRLESCREGDENQKLRRVCPQQYKELTDLRHEIDHMIFELFGFSPRQRRAICKLSDSRVF
jgi:N-6 DNA Methylase